MGYKKVCFIIPGLNAGGIENYLLRFLKQLPPTYAVTVVVRSRKNTDMYDEYQKTNCVIRFQSVGYFNIKKLGKLYSFFKENKFDTVCDFSGNFGGVTLFTASLAGVKNRIVFYRRSTNAFKETKLNLIYAFIANRLVGRYATRILSNSGFAFEHYFGKRAKGDSRFIVIPNGVDASVVATTYTKEEARAALGLPRETFIVGHVGRYDKAKNHETIFRAAKMLAEKYDDIRFLFCGKDTDTTAFAEALAEHGIKEVSITLGLRKDLPMVYKTIDVFYFPSITEGQPNALIEALFAGLPAVCSDIAPIKEVIPSAGQKYLLNSLDASGAANLISALKEHTLNEEELIFRKEIINKFDAANNFKLFENEL